MRLRHVLLACLVTAPASAQPGVTPPQKPQQPQKAPQDPYGDSGKPIGPTPAPTPVPAPTPAPTPTKPDDPVLAEQVAAALVQRAQELYDARVWVDAKQLAVEALVKSPKGPSADQARFLIKQVNQQLGIVDPEDKPADVDKTPIEDPTKGKVETPPGEQPGSTRLSASIHSALYVGLLGTTVGAFFDDKQPAGGAVPVGIAAGLAAGLYLPRLIDKLHWNEGQIRTVGSATAWGGVVGGLFGDIAKTKGTTAREVLVSASVGSTLAGAGGVLLARDDRYTAGDIALADTLGGIGGIGGLALGMVMQPHETEAYDLNAALGASAGIVVGLVAAPQTNTTPRRMARVAGLSFAGAAAPFLLYAGIHDPHSQTDERVTGMLSIAGMLGGAYLGFRLTEHMDEGKDVSPMKKRDPDDAPPTLLGRNSTGHWQLGSVALQPLSQQLAPQHGMAMSLVGGAW